MLLLIKLSSVAHYLQRKPSASVCSRSFSHLSLIYSVGLFFLPLFIFIFPMALRYYKNTFRVREERTNKKTRIFFNRFVVVVYSLLCIHGLRSIDIPEYRFVVAGSRFYPFPRIYNKQVFYTYFFSKESQHLSD